MTFINTRDEDWWKPMCCLKALVFQFILFFTLFPFSGEHYHCPSLLYFFPSFLNVTEFVLLQVTAEKAVPGTDTACLINNGKGSFLQLLESYKSAQGCRCKLTGDFASSPSTINIWSDSSWSWEHIRSWSVCYCW